LNISVILSGGNGIRFGSELPKQYHLLFGKEVIAYVYDALKASELTDEILIVSSRNMHYEAGYVPGGNTHNESVGNALKYIYKHYDNCESVLFVDSARPFVTADVIDELYKRIKDADAITTAQKITDSLGRDGIKFVDRSDYYLIQKPAVFNFNILYKHFSATSETTAIIQQIPLSCRVKQYYGLKQNMKITYPEDLQFAERLMGMQGELL